jgi:hypothetical protein
MLNVGNYLKYTIISKKINRSAGVTNTTIATPESLANGETVVTDLSNKVLDDTQVGAYKKIKVVQGQGVGKPLLQVELDIDETKVYSGAPYRAAVEQVSYIGFNGTAGNIPATTVAGENFNFSPFLNWINGTFFLGRQNVLPYGGPYVAEGIQSSDTISAGIAKSFIKNFSKIKEFRPFVKVERVVNGTRTAPGASGTLTFTKGSNVVVASAAAAINAPVVVGDFLSTGSALTNGVYKVTAISGTDVTIDIPFQGNTVSVAATGNIRIASAGATLFGIKFTGEKDLFEINVFDQYQKVRFALGGEINGAPITYSISADEGAGVPELVQIDENISMGNQGKQYLLGVPPTPRPSNVDFAGTYSQINIGFYTPTAGIAGHGSVKGNLIVYADKDVNGSPAGFGTNSDNALNNTALINVLDAWAAQKGFAAANV